MAAGGQGCAQCERERLTPDRVLVLLRTFAPGEGGTCDRERKKSERGGCCSIFLPGMGRPLAIAEDERQDVRPPPPQPALGRRAGGWAAIIARFLFLEG